MKYTTPGPWDDEPDELIWTTADGHTGYIRRHPEMGHLCGYIGVSETSPAHGWTADELHGWDWAVKEGEELRKPSFLLRLDIHGGLTFSGFWEKFPGLWFFGFDCSHGMDLAPGMLKYGNQTGTYRTIDYVQSNCTELSAELGKWELAEVLETMSKIQLPEEVK